MVKILNIIFLLLAFSLNAYAQQLITSDITISKPLSIFSYENNVVRVDPAKHKATLRVFTFDKYVTYELALSGPDFSKDRNSTLYFSWVGSTNKIAAISQDGPMYAVANNSGVDGLFGYNSEVGWMVAISKKLVNNCITNIHSGCSITDVREAIMSLGAAVSLKETGTKQNLKEYTLYGLQLHDHPFLNKSTARTDDPYAKFYFDANNKLVKWYMDR